MKYTIRVSKILATAIAIALAGAVEASAQTADVAGEYQRYAAKPAVIDPSCGSARP